MPTTTLVIYLATLSSLYASPDTGALRLDPETIGSCISDNGLVDLSKVMFLENRSLDWNGSSGPIRITLLRQSVHIRDLSAAQGDTYVRNIGSVVARGEDRADVYLKLALLDNAPVIYWRETYQYRIYRQGIFRIAGHDLVRLCEGRGGETIMD